MQTMSKIGVEGDPDWGDGKGRGIIGALNYLASQHVNSIYFLTMNVGGDGKDVWPWIGPIDPKGSPNNDNLHFDIAQAAAMGNRFQPCPEAGNLSCISCSMRPKRPISAKWMTASLGRNENSITAK